MLFTDVMVMTTMATACVWSFLEVDEEEEAEVVVEVVEHREDPRGGGMVLRPDARSTGLLCQVGDVFLLLQVLLISLPKVYSFHL